MADEAQSILAPAQIDNSAKADAWQVFKDTANEREFGAKLQTMTLPQNVKADLWEAKRRVGQQSIVPDANAQAQKVISGIPKYDTSPLATGQPDVLGAAQRTPGYNDYMKQSGSLAGSVAGTMATGGILPAIKNLPIANRLISALGRAGATGVGAGTGALAGGATPPEAAVTAAGGAIGQPIAEGITAAASPIIKWIGASKTVGAKLLQQASTKAGNAPVELSAETNRLVDEIVREGKSGGHTPKIISDLLDRLGPSTRQAAEAEPGALTYNEARNFQSNTGLSVSEQMDLKGRMRSLMPQFAKSFSQDVQAAADQAGIGAEHAQGMKEYAMALSRNRALSKIGKSLPYAAGGYGAYRELHNLKK